MSAIHVLFATEVIAYEFLSEIRRQTDFLLWDVQVRKEVVAYELLSEIRRQTDFLLWDVEVQHGNYGADVVSAKEAWDREPFMESVASTYGGDVRADSSPG
jgi:hypothetical protein